MKTCLIRQPAGAGDILFTQKIVKHLAERSDIDRIVWPVIKEYDYLHDYIGCDKIQYICEHESFPFKEIYNSHINTLHETEDLLYIPLQHADQTCTYSDPRCHGYIKYKFCNNLSWKDWKEYVIIKRNPEREQALIEKLDIDMTKPFNAINYNYGSPPNSLIRSDVESDNDYRDVIMDYMDGVNIFDWMGIMEKAHGIYMVETCFHHLCEILNLKNVHIFSRLTHGTDITDNFAYVKPHCSSEWKYVR